MNSHEKPTSNENENSVRLTRRGKALAWAAGIGLTAGLIGAGIEANDSDFHGEQTVQIDEKTVIGIAENHVEGVEGHINDTVDKIVEMNPDVFEDGKAFVGSEDVGATIEIPKSVD